MKQLLFGITLAPDSKDDFRKFGVLQSVHGHGFTRLPLPDPQVDKTLCTTLAARILNPLMLRHVLLFSCNIR
jgi:hypothetical protein